MLDSEVRVDEVSLTLSRNPDFRGQFGQNI